MTRADKECTGVTLKMVIEMMLNQVSSETCRLELEQRTDTSKHVCSRLHSPIGMLRVSENDAC